MTIIPGTEFEIDAGNLRGQSSLSKLDLTNIIAGYRNDTSTFSVVIQSDETIGTKFEHGSNDDLGVAVTALSDTKALLIYVSGGNADIRAVVLNISGTTITTPGAELSLGFNGTATTLDIVAVSSTAAIVAVADKTSSPIDDGVGIYLTVSGNTITNESSVIFKTSAANGVDRIRIQKLSTTKAIVGYDDADNSSKVTCVVLSISGVTISTGTPKVIDSADSTGGSQFGFISDTQTLLAYQNITEADVKVQVLTISGTTITENTTDSLGQNSNRNAIAAYSATKFALTLRGVSDWEVSEITVLGTTVNAGTLITQDDSGINVAISSAAFSASLALNIHRGTTEGTLLTLITGLAISAMTRPADIDASNTFIYVALLDGGVPILTKIATSLSSDGTTIFNPGTGDNIGVQCGRFDNNIIWVAGNFDSTNVVEKSENAGTTFVVKDNGSTGNVKSFIMGPDSDDKVLIFDETNGDILETVNNGGVWTVINASVIPEIAAMGRLPVNVEETVVGNDSAASNNASYSVNSGADLEDTNFPVEENITTIIVN